MTYKERLSMSDKKKSELEVETAVSNAQSELDCQIAVTVSELKRAEVAVKQAKADADVARNNVNFSIENILIADGAIESTENYVKQLEDRISSLKKLNKEMFG
ncbi:MAG: hypothetical protein V3S79_00910 [Candidatus Thermoplasmatota archaeon]